MELKGHGEAVTFLSWRPKAPDTLASTSSDKTVRFWDARSSARPTGSYSSPVGAVMLLSWHPSEPLVALANRDNSVSVLDARRMKVVKSHRFEFQVMDVCWAPLTAGANGGSGGSSQTLLVSSGHGTVELFSYPSWEHTWSLPCHSSSCYCMALSRSGKLLATGGADASVGIWDLAHVAPLRSVVRMDQPVRSIAFSADSSYVAYAGEDPVVEVVSVSSGEVVWQQRLAQASDSVAFNPVHGALLAYAGDDNNREGAGMVGIAAPPKPS